MNLLSRYTLAAAVSLAMLGSTSVAYALSQDFFIKGGGVATCDDVRDKLLGLGAGLSIGAVDTNLSLHVTSLQVGTHEYKAPSGDSYTIIFSPGGGTGGADKIDWSLTGGAQDLSGKRPKSSAVKAGNGRTARVYDPPAFKDEGLQDQNSTQSITELWICVTNDPITAAIPEGCPLLDPGIYQEVFAVLKQDPYYTSKFDASAGQPPPELMMALGTVGNNFDGVCASPDSTQGNCDTDPSLCSGITTSGSPGTIGTTPGGTEGGSGGTVSTLTASATVTNNFCAIPTPAGFTCTTCSTTIVLNGSPYVMSYSADLPNGFSCP